GAGCGKAAASVTAAPAAMRREGTVFWPERSISVSSAWGWGPTRSEKSWPSSSEKPAAESLRTRELPRAPSQARHRLERRDRIQRNTRASGRGPRRGGQQNPPPPQPRGLLRGSLQIHHVDERQPHRDDGELMDRPGIPLDARRLHVVHGIVPEQRDVS